MLLAKVPHDSNIVASIFGSEVGVIGEDEASAAEIEFVRLWRADGMAWHLDARSEYQPQTYAPE